MKVGEEVAGPRGEPEGGRQGGNEGWRIVRPSGGLTEAHAVFRMNCRRNRAGESFNVSSSFFSVNLKSVEGAEEY